MKFTIKARWIGNVLFTAEIADDTEPRFQVRAALEKAVKADANLAGANLVDAYLAGVDLVGADLVGANLAGAYLTDAIKAVARDEAIANLDKVREIILDDSRRLNMGDWHQDGSKWQEHTCAEEALCGTTHCLAGWLQVCATDDHVRKLDAFTAGCIQAPMAASLFYSDHETVLAWLKTREYAKAKVAA